MAGWILVAVVLLTLACGGGLFLLLWRGGADPAIEARFDAWCR